MISRTIAVILSLTIITTGCSTDPEPVVLSEEEMVTAFEQRATGFHEAMIPVYSAVIRELDDGVYGSSDQISSVPPSLVHDPRVRAMCDDMVTVKREFDAKFDGVERTARYDDLDEAYDNMPGLSYAAILVALLSEDMITIPGYPQDGEFNLAKRFPEDLTEYHDIEIESDGQLNTWKTRGTLQHVLIQSFDDHVADCYFSTLEERNDR